MSNIQQQLQERLQFYTNAYMRTEKHLTEEKALITALEKQLDEFAQAITTKWLGEDLDDEEKRLIQDKFGIDLQKIKEELAQRKLEIEKQIQELKKRPNYQEYLDMMMNDEINVITKLEDDEVFMYLIKENFHNAKFTNEPSIKILGFHYQPRFWKFKKVANKKAKEYFFESYERMFEFWSNIRQSFNSLLGQEPAKTAIAKGQKIDAEITQKQEEINLLSQQEIVYVIQKVADMLEVVSDDKMTMFNATDKENLFVLRGKFEQKELLIKDLSERLTAISKNIGIVEEMFQKSEFIDSNSTGFKAFLQNDNPTKPVFEMIPENEWHNIKEAFAKKGIELKNKEDYSVVKTKLTQEQEAYYKNKYNVKEGEIFFDEKLK